MGKRCILFRFCIIHYVDVTLFKLVIMVVMFNQLKVKILNKIRQGKRNFLPALSL